MRVSVVIPAFNNWQLTEACVATLRAATPASLLADVIVVDDGSTDGVSAPWAATQATFRGVLAARNGGFSRACNLGAAAGGGEVLLFLNNDAYVTPGSIATMLETLESTPAIGIVGARLLYADGTLQHAGLGLLAGAVSRWWHIHRQLPGALTDANVPRDLLAVTGAALMIRRSLFDELGGFDAGYTNGWEDVDLCLRTWCRGLRVRYEPRAAIEHLESATLGRSHDDGANERRFTDRWSAVLDAAPRYPLAEIPPLALALRRACAPHERWVRAHLKRAWAPFVGAKVRRVRAASRLDRLRFEIDAALAKRRPTLEVSLGDAALDRATGRQRVAWVAPSNAREAAAAVTTTGVTAWWTPTEAGRRALVAAGAAADRVTVVGLGAAPAFAPERRGRLVVAAPRSAVDVLRAFAVRMPGARTIELPADRAPDLRAVDIVLARAGGDRWGLLVPTALAHGCHVVVSPPLDAHLHAAAGVKVVDDGQMLAALLELAADVDAVRDRATAVALAARRRYDVALAAQHAAQLARAIAHGIPSAGLAAVDTALAEHLRRAGQPPRAVLA